MSGMTDILMIGLVLVGGYYLLASGVLTGQTPATAPAPYNYTTPAAPVAPTVLPTLETQCTSEGGIWQGDCCSCPNAGCSNKCGEIETDEVDACENEDGVWQENRAVPCCSCPNKECSRKCGSIKEEPSGGIAGTISKAKTIEGLCRSEGPVLGTRPNLRWGNTWTGSCCSCPNRTCQNKCKAAAAKLPSKGSGKAQPSSPPSSRKPAPKGAVTLKKPTAATKCPNGKSYAACPKCKSQCNSPGFFDACCRANAKYAHAYLAGSSSRLGPGYTGRDTYQHISDVEFPSHIDFEQQIMDRPYYLGPVSRERHELLNRFQSNFASMRFSG